MQKEEFLEVASRFGRRMAKQALWDGRECTWSVLSPDRSNREKRSSVSKTATGELYQGASGIAAFLGELYAQNGQKEIERAALGGIRYALRLGQDLPENSFGFHSGRTGIAYAAHRLSQVLQRPDLSEQALALVEPMAGKESQDNGIDVIAGAAGAIPALIHLHRATGSPLCLDIATGLGDHLLQTAHRAPEGWSWGTIGNSAVRHLAGLAHGASGIGLALLELAWATGTGCYRFGSEMAFLYERRHFSAEHSNWPDLRHKEIGDLLYYATPEDLRQAALAGRIPPYEPKYMSAWCHGSPGIGLSRLRAFELTGQPVYRQEAEAALRSTTDSFEGNFSLCHGVAGNCELPLEASLAWDDASLRQTCLDCATSGWERYGKPGNPWPCGTMNSQPDPSLMLGEAGIGYFYLRLYDPSTPSVLLLHPQHPAQPPSSKGQSFDQLGDASVREYFGQTLAVLKALEKKLELPPASRQQPLMQTPVENAFELIEQAVQNANGSGELLQDGFKLERERYLLTLQVTDFTQEYLRLLTRPPLEEVDWEKAEFCRADFTLLVQQQFDWTGWLASRDGSAPPRSESVSLLYRQSNRIHSRPIGSLAALVLQALETPLRADRLFQEIARQAEAENESDRHKLAAMVKQQLQFLYQAGFVDWSQANQA